MKISYYQKQRIIKRIIDVIMVAFLLLTLSPIGWMIYSSFKENTDILVGKVSLSRAKNACQEIHVDDKYIYICTADGGISKFDKTVSRQVEHASTRTMSTNFAFDRDHIWVSSANRGLSRISKNDLRRRKDFKLPLADIDLSRIAGTMLVREDDFVWFSMRYRGFESIIEFDVNKQTAARVFDLRNELSPVQVTSFIKAGNVFWVGTDKGLLKYDIKEKKVTRALSTSDLIPRGITSMLLFKDRLLIAGATGVFEFSPTRFRIVRMFNKASGLLSDQAESLAAKDNNIFIGTNAGLSVMDTTSGEIRNFTGIFEPVSDQGDVIAGKLTAGSVTTLNFDGSSVLIGGTAGRMSELDLYMEKITRSLAAGKGHMIVAWRNYVDMWKNINFGLFLRNSFIICGLTMFFAMVFATLAAYAISRFRFPGAGLFSMSILATQMVPGIMFLIPIYIMFIKFTEWTGIPMRGTFFGMIFIYTAFFVPFSIWILRGFFAAIPYELEEAARIDGCSPFQVFWHIVLPLAVPGIIATGIYVFLTAWDELMFAWILTSGDTMTIPVGIRNFVGNYQNRFDLLMAASTVATIPVMILFFMLQKHIVKGLTAGAVKG